MPDVFTAEKRSEVMSRIRSSGTAIEERLFILVQSCLGNGWKISKNERGLPGAPDIHVPQLRLVVFVDGCFYHMCPKHGRIPDSNRTYWEPKLQANRKRDNRNRDKLRRMGYAVWRVWEHDLNRKNVDRTARMLEKRIEKLIERRTMGQHCLAPRNEYRSGDDQSVYRSRLSCSGLAHFINELALVAETDMEKNSIQEAVQRLDRRHRKALILRYGLSGGQPRTWSEIAGALGLSVSAAQRLGSQAVRMVREECAPYDVGASAHQT